MQRTIRSGSLRNTFFQLAIPLIFGIIALFIPLIRDLHFESAMVASVAGCFIAAIVSARLPKKANEAFYLLKIAGWIYLPALVLLIAVLIRGCFSVDGLLFWIFNPSLSILFGYAVGRYFRVNGFRRSTLWANLILIFVAIGLLLFELYSLPQLYFFNHVWGYWPGPIYDEEVSFTTSVILFRFITLCWVGLFWLIPHFWVHRQAQYLTLIVLIGLTLSYLRLSESGIVSPNEFIEQQLGSIEQAGNTELFFSGNHTPEPELNRLTALHEFHIEELSDTLNVAPGTISSYIYPHAWKKKDLTGAKFTSYVPVWNPRDQLHLNRQAVDGSLRHELAHVISKEFGNRLLNASWSVGLLEGVAVALSPAEQQRATVDQMVVANEAWLEPDEINRLFSITGFYRQAGPMSYTIAGSFVGYLLKNYPVEKFKTAYRHSSLEAGYETPLDSLQAGWKRHLQTVEVDEKAEIAGLQAFAIPSIFDQKCPRLVTPYQESMDRYRHHLAEKDTSGALHALDDAIRAEPENPGAFYQKFRLLAFQKQWDEILNQEIPKEKEWIRPLLITSDAMKSTGNAEAAYAHLDSIKTLDSDDNQHQKSLSLRSSYWDDFLDVNYYSGQLNPDHVSQLSQELQWVWLTRLFEKENYNLLIEATLELEPKYTSDYHRQLIRISEYLAANSHHETAGRWLQSVPRENLRPVMQDQLEQAIRFVEFTSDF